MVFSMKVEEQKKMPSSDGRLLSAVMDMARSENLRRVASPGRERVRHDDDRA